MNFDILTIFPEYFDVLKSGLIGKAIESGKFSVNIVNIRDFSQDKHFKTDDTPYGGGAGMVMTPDPLVRAIEGTDPNHNAKRIYLSPKGRTLNQKVVQELAKEERLMFVCGNYEGIDERVIDLCIDDEISIGDYVLTGGELASLVCLNAVARYIDGVLHSSESTSEESFSTNLLEYPQYTRPAEYRGLKVPEVLLNGNHKEIAKWRYEKALEITKERRPDLLEKDKEDK
ncbi:MAG: tRNA (guanosine(37)-N1)-methyltransferase TrmD [Clostridia bacterium]|nr:tRNA (guanosine(37)-N1)-methyltransferase TrmD [Clostridia bacterium]